jgi:hypothetical protein
MSPFRFRSWHAAVALLIVAGALLSAVSSGCDSKKPPTTAGQQSSAATKDSEATALAALEAQQDAAHCRTVLQQLDNLESARTRPTLSDSERGELTALFRLTPTEVAEISQPTFSLTDTAYLEECLLVRAGVRSLKIDGRPPLEKARLGFDWACRMVYVDDRVPWPANPWTTLQAGCGVALSRAYVVLAAWQQLGLNGCLIGPPTLKSTPSKAYDVPGGPVGSYAPVRACGLKVGGDVFLFDHAAGQAIPAADGKGVLTLAQAKAGPDAVKSIAGADEVKAWQPYLAPSLSCLARRMDWLERLNPANSGVNLFVDIRALRDQFTADLPGQPVDGWNPEGDAHTATRILGRYATEEASTRGKISLRDAHRVRMVPLEHMPRMNLMGEAAGHIDMAFGQRFELLRYTWGSPRDSLVRGMFREATAALEPMKKDMDNARTRMDQDKELQKDFETWAEAFQALSAKHIRARERDPASLPAVEGELMRFRNHPRNRDIELAFVLGNASRPLGAELTFLMASAVHERAERAQIDGSARATEQWHNARFWWDSFLDASAQAHSPFPAREAHGKALRARCEQFISK